MEELAGQELVSSQKAEERVEELLEAEASIAVGAQRNSAETLSLNELDDAGLSLNLEDQVLAMEIERKVSSVWQREALLAVEEMKRREGQHVEEILKLQTANKKLKFARMRAEMEVTYWQKKYAELETRSLGSMDLKRSLGMKVGRNILEDDFCEDTKSHHPPKLKAEDVRGKSDGAVQAGLGTSCAGGVVVITDSEDETEKQEHDSRIASYLESTCSHGDEGRERFSNGLPMALNLDVMMRSGDSSPGENWISASTPKRKRMSAVVMSDSEDAEDEPKERFSNELSRALKHDGTMRSGDSSPGENWISASTPKRKRMSTVVMSDGEDAKDEPKEIATEEIKKKKLKAIEDRQSSSSNYPLADYSNEDDEKVSRMPSRRHLIPLSQLREGRGGGKLTSPGDSSAPMFSSGAQESSSAGNEGNARQRLKFPTVKGTENDDEDAESSESESEGDSLDGFIADESSGSDEEVCETPSEQEVSSDSSTGHVFSRFRQEKSSMKWEYEGDMLASFGKDPVICMKAVCALYRQQTADEKSVRGTLLTNNRGFNRIDAKRGSYIAEFLTDGNSLGPLVKSVDNLQAYYPGGVEHCYKLATHYSKQLFMIYQSGEDPHFRPP